MEVLIVILFIAVLLTIVLKEHKRIKSLTFLRIFNVDFYEEREKKKSADARNTNRNPARTKSKLQQKKRAS